MKECVVRILGLTSYAEALALQRFLVSERMAGRIPDTLVLLEHPPVITLGRSGTWDHLLGRREDVEIIETDRGGDITFHGPGQLVGYPIIDLHDLNRDVKWYLNQLEEVMIRTAGEFRVAARHSDQHTGVWVGTKKLGAIGVRIQRWITSHGFALNINTDLKYFGLIIPCGLSGKGVTSMAEILAKELDFHHVLSVAARCFGEVFGRRIRYEEQVIAQRPQGRA